MLKEYLGENHKRYHKQLTLVGGIDNQFIDGGMCSDEEVRESVRKTYAELIPYGSYVPLGLLMGEKRDIALDEMKNLESQYYGPRPDADKTNANAYGRMKTE